MKHLMKYKDYIQLIFIYIINLIHKKPFAFLNGLPFPVSKIGSFVDCVNYTNSLTASETVIFDGRLYIYSYKI